MADPVDPPWHCCAELFSSVLQGWMFQLVSLIGFASVWIMLLQGAGVAWHVVEKWHEPLSGDK